MQIDLLYFDGCASWKGALENLRAALSAEDLEADIHLVKVNNSDEAARLKFLGSPSFQVGGVDLWLEERQEYGLSCRVYRTPEGIRGVPSQAMLREKLRRVHR
jgi:hypothetical protein